LPGSPININEHGLYTETRQKSISENFSGCWHGFIWWRGFLFVGFVF